MKEELAEIMVSSLENLLQATGIPMALADEIKDDEIRRAVGNLCGLIVGELDYKILPLVYKSFPKIKVKRGDKDE